MSKYQLLVDTAGRAILACPERLDSDRAAAIKAAFNTWRDAQPPELLIAGETEVIRVESIDLALAPAGDQG